MSLVYKETKPPLESVIENVTLKLVEFSKRIKMCSHIGVGNCLQLLPTHSLPYLPDVAKWKRFSIQYRGRITKSCHDCGT